MQYERNIFMNRKKIFVFGHGSGINRGCEAIIRSISDLIVGEFDAEVTVCAVDATYDRTLNYTNINKFIDYPRFRKGSVKWIINKIDERFFSKGKLTLSVCHKNIINEISKSDICISVGGDNYCYSDPYRYYAIDYYVKKLNKPLIMYGASIEPTMMNGIMKKDLSTYDLIIARESITYNALKQFMGNDRVCLYPDPAFTLKLQQQSLPDNFSEGNIVGLNVSPLVMKYEQEKGITRKAFEHLVDTILCNGRQILLIPHVTQKGNSDYDTLKSIAEKYKNDNNILLVGKDLTAEQYKGYIKKCRIFIGARTHSTIAAYSLGIPTLVLGYSVKSKGIDFDIMNNKFKMLLSVQNLCNPDALAKSYKYTEENYDLIKSYLENKMKEYKPKAYESVKELYKFLEK